MSQDDEAKPLEAPPEVPELPGRPINSNDGAGQVAWALLEVAKQIHHQTLAIHAVLEEARFANDRLQGIELDLDNIHTILEGR